MDLKEGETETGSGNDKRKLPEVDTNLAIPKKKVCIEGASTTVDSPTCSSEISTTNLQDSSASSSDSKVISEQSQDLENKLSFFDSSGSYLQNQSLNIGSTTESLDDLQSGEVSLSDINIDPFISAACEASETASGSTESKINSFLKGSNDTNSNIDSTKDVSNVVGHLNRKEEQQQTSQVKQNTSLTSNMTSCDTKNTKVSSSTTTDMSNVDNSINIVSSSNQSDICGSKPSVDVENKIDNVIDVKKQLSVPDNENARSVIKDGNLLKQKTDVTVATEENVSKTETCLTAAVTEGDKTSIKDLIKENQLKTETNTTGINKDNVSKNKTNVSEENSLQTKKSSININDDNSINTIKVNTTVISEDALKIGSSLPEKQEIKCPEPESRTNKQCKSEENSSIGLETVAQQNLPTSANVRDAGTSNPEELKDVAKNQLPDIQIKESNPSLNDEITKSGGNNLSFKKSLENITLPSNKPQAIKSVVDSAMPEIETETEDKKSEISTMEIDSTNYTPIEGSLLNTPCESGETSPSNSTPLDSCQASAAPSPLLKDEVNLISESLLYDESSVDVKEQDEEEIKPVKLTKKKRKKAPVKPKKNKGKTAPVIVDEETRMSGNGTLDIGVDEDSQSSTGVSKKEPRRYRCEVIVPESTEVFTADKVNEYLWPLEGVGEHYFIQEHISRYLGIMSFKRKYPDVRRRPIESQEKEYLKDLGLVSEMACDLGLTAVRSEDLLDIMFADFAAKYEELQRVLRERKEKQLKEKVEVDYQVVNLDKSKMKEYSRKAALNASKWNAAFNREKNEERKFSFDLQTFTLHVQSRHNTRASPYSSRMGSYPVAVLPGQYTDYCKRYSFNELRGMPLQTVMAGPFTAEELAADLQADSDNESRPAGYGTIPDIKEELDIPPVVDPLSAEKQPRCKVCNGGRARNKDGKPEPLIICGTCRTASHPTCIDLTLVMIEKIEAYSWQCMDCKTCAQCNDPDDEERMIFCDMCDRGYHIYCVGLRRVPNGRWHCKECAVCYTCGARNPSGSEHIKNAEWQHEFKKNKDNKQLRYTCTLCVPCDKYWKRRQFCSVCMKVYRSIPEDGMVRCSGCPKYVHKDGCSILHESERYCNTCFKSRNKTALNHSRIIAAAKKKMATGSKL